MAESLLKDGYRVVGLVPRFKGGFDSLKAAEILEADISDPDEMASTLRELRPDEFYHLAAAHHSSEQSTEEELRWRMLRVNFMSTQAILSAIAEGSTRTRFLYAGSSQMYTVGTGETRVNEATPPRPSTYYGITKHASMELIDLWRREKGLFGGTAILFNHESTRRAPQYVSRKVTQAAARAKRGDKAKLKIRDLNAGVDWSAAEDFISAMRAMQAAQVPGDYVLASGKVRTVRELLETAYGTVGLAWQDYAEVEEQTGPSRPCLVGDPSLAQKQLGWKAQKDFKTMIREMVEHDSRNSHN